MQAATGINIDRLRKSFSSSPTGPAAVDSISLTIEPGELFFLLGPSGCGKTTLLRMIAGFIEPTSGKLWFDFAGQRQDVTSLPPERRNTGMVFQSYALWPHMTVEGNVGFGLDVRKIVGIEKKRRVGEALEAVKMSEYASRRPTQLSGGQQQRVALARAIVIRPAVLLLDEPLSNLDAKLRIELRSEIRRLCKLFGMTTVYVTHDQKEALSMADRIAILRDGRVEQVGTPRGLYTKPRTAFAASFLGETNFLAAQLIATDEVKLKSVTVKTSHGEGRPLGSVIVSVRPEAITVSRARGSKGLRGTLTESVYLGDAVQFTVELEGGERLLAAMHNPGTETPAIGQAVELGIAADDVVIVES